MRYATPEHEAVNLGEAPTVRHIVHFDHPRRIVFEYAQESMLFERRMRPEKMKLRFDWWCRETGQFSCAPAFST